MERTIHCPHCGGGIVQYANPVPTTDVIIYDPARGVVIVRRRNEPHGYALPGGFVDEGESVEAAAVREAREETSLEVRLTGLLGVYSRPDRDPRSHTLSVVFVGRALHSDALRAGDDAAEAAFYSLDALPSPIVFDHADILQDFREELAGRRSLAHVQPRECG